MNLKQLEAFVKVAETKSFSEAAKQLFLTQPTISAHVSALEKELNTCFLIRNTRGVELSESGKELYAYAVQMLEIEKTIKGRFGKEIKPEGNVPVSYTHLDVYKRQEYRRNSNTGEAWRG